MNRLPLFVALTIGMLLGSAATWWISHRSMAGMSDAVPSTAAAAEKPVLYWYDPMVPNQHFDKPGKSPFMDMELVPKYAGAADDSAGSVSIDPRLVQNLGVRTGTATLGTLSATLRSTGTVAFDETAVTLVQARVAGIVEQLKVRAPLNSVVKGEHLMTLLAPEWTAAQGEYLSLRQARGPGLEALRSAARQRLSLLGMSEAQIRAVERSGRAQQRIAIHAPRAGIVGELLVREGASVMAGTPLLRINGLDPVWINAAVPEAQLARVMPGATVRIETPAYPGESFAGEVQTLLPELDALTRTQTARIVVANPKQRLVPGMYARVQVLAGAAQAKQVLLPSEAVIATGTRNVVIVELGEGRFRAQEIRIGDEADGQTVVLEGLQADSKVVLSGQFLIDSEASLLGTLARLESAPSEASEASAEDAEPAVTQYATGGTVKSIEGQKWAIATDTIPELEMGAMRMTFILSESLPANDIQPGQRVSFSFFRNSDGDFEISKISIEGQP